MPGQQQRLWNMIHMAGTRNYWLIRRYTEAENVQYDPVRRRVNYELDGYPAHLDLKALLK